MSKSRTHYQSYLLRLWRNDAGELLHASLQSSESGSIYHLKDINELLVFLSLDPKDSASLPRPEKTTEIDKLEEDNHE
jgi:hypothetical protein